MNERPVGETGIVQDPVAPATHQRTPWSKSIAVALLVTVMGLTLLPAGVTFAQDQASSSDGSDSTGIQIASWLLTIPYCAGKSAFAVAGSVVGGLGYAFSGGNSETAQAIWTKSVYGTYILRPAHLRGEEPIHFVGQSDEYKSETVKRAAATSNHADK
jgi:hypothetical protein